MLFVTAIATLATAVSASVIPRDVRGLDVHLTAEGNTLIKAVITNNNEMDIQLLSKGTFLDQDQVEKVVVNLDGKAVPFTGIRKRVSTSGLSEEAFTPLAAGASIEISIDMAAVHDLSSGGSFKVSTSGAIPFALANSTELVTETALTYASNELDITVDGTEAAKVPRAYPLLKRTNLQTQTCNANQRQALTTSFRSCSQVSSAAASAAQSGDAAKFREYFKTTSSSTRGNVAARFRAIATECGSTTSGQTEYHCNDVYQACSPGVLAYTLPSQDLVVSCPIFFSNLPVGLSRTCHAQDQATTILHEFAHAPGVYAPGTDDNGYGYAAATALTASQALDNADSYALYANAIYLNC